MKGLERLLVVATMLVSAVWSGGSAAQDTGLYDAPPDPNASFVRLFASAATTGLVSGAPVAFSEKGVSGYVSVPAGQVAITIGDQSITATVEPSAYYTYVLLDGQMVSFEDQALTDPSRSQVYLYNLSQLRSVDLHVPAAQTDAIQGVASGTSKSIALRAPLILDFEARSEGKVVATATAVALERKAGVSLFLTNSNAGVELVQAPNTVASD